MEVVSIRNTTALHTMIVTKADYRGKDITSFKLIYRSADSDTYLLPIPFKQAQVCDTIRTSSQSDWVESQVAVFKTRVIVSDQCNAFYVVHIEYSDSKIYEVKYKRIEGGQAHEIMWNMHTKV